MIYLCDYLAQIIPTAGDEHVAPAEWVVIARRVRLCELEIKLRLICLALTEGATWTQVAETLGLEETEVRDVYQDAYERWASGERRTWSSAWRHASLPVDIDGDDMEPLALARLQDEWLHARYASDPRAQVRDPAPVSRGLR